MALLVLVTGMREILEHSVHRPLYIGHRYSIFSLISPIPPPLHRKLKLRMGCNQKYQFCIHVH